ncbi:MAG: hypothetical protein NUV77_13340 [Thermoguttaceae bacterium]|jgi:DNA-directed RNA polymerase subunit RPC12/RpoP|nr:hypothetical protein [Thermoguttaceae bacterium]
MIRVICSNCGSKLDAKDEIAGQTRKCPKCRQPVLIPAAEAKAAIPEPSPDASASSTMAPPAEAPVRHFVAPERLIPHDRYLICDRTKVFAVWEGGSEGWLLRTDFGYTSVARNADKLPSQGDFKLVELRMSVEHEKPLLRGLAVYQLARRWALTTLVRGDDAILKTIIGPGSLNREQKSAVRKYLGERMMREVWGDNQAVLEYLANYDFHSPGAGVGP